MRTFTDARGLTWTVWAVRPGRHTPGGMDRRIAPIPAEQLPYPDRRIKVRPEFAEGWLAFHAADGSRRRLTPVPDAWEAFTDAELERCCHSAREMPSVWDGPR